MSQRDVLKVEKDRNWIWRMKAKSRTQLFFFFNYSFYVRRGNDLKRKYGSSK